MIWSQASFTRALIWSQVHCNCMLIKPSMAPRKVASKGKDGGMYENWLSKHGRVESDAVPWEVAVTEKKSVSWCNLGFLFLGVNAGTNLLRSVAGDAFCNYWTSFDLFYSLNKIVYRTRWLQTHKVDLLLSLSKRFHYLKRTNCTQMCRADHDKITASSAV